MSLFCSCKEEIQKLNDNLIEVHRQVITNSKHIYFLKQQVDAIDQVLYRLATGQALSAKLTIDGESMPASIAIGGKGAQAVFTEFSGLAGTGTVIAPVAPIAFSSSDPTIATVDPVSGAIVAVAVGTATITGTDSGSSLSASDTVTVTPELAQSATLVVTAN
jgi:hypothetical protein